MIYLDDICRSSIHTSDTPNPRDIFINTAVPQSIHSDTPNSAMS